MPTINPNCIADVIWPSAACVKSNSFARSGMIAFPANQREVHKNCAVTITGNMRFEFFILVYFLGAAFQYSPIAYF